MAEWIRNQDTLCDACGTEATCYETELGIIDASKRRTVNLCPICWRMPGFMCLPLQQNQKAQRDMIQVAWAVLLATRDGDLAPFSTPR